MRTRLLPSRRLLAFIGALTAAVVVILPVGASAGPDAPPGGGSGVQVVQPWNQFFKVASMIHPGVVAAEPDLAVGVLPFDDSSQDRRWYAEPNIAKGGYNLTNLKHPGKCLDTADADPMKDGAGLVLRTCDDSYRQSWVLAFDPVRTNTLRLVNYMSKLVVTVTAPNTKVAGLVVTAYRPHGMEQTFATDNCTQCG